MRRGLRAGIAFLVWLVAAWLMVAGDAGAGLELDLVTSHKASGRAADTWRLDWRRGSWRCRGERRGGNSASQRRRGTLTGPGRGPLRAWVVGRFDLRTGLGAGGLKSSAGSRVLLRLAPSAAGAWLGTAGEFGWRNCRWLLAAGSPATTATDRPPEWRRLQWTGGVAREHGALSWAALAGLASANRRPALLVSAGARYPAGSWRFEIVGGPTGGRELVLAARGVASGEARFHLRLRQAGAPALGARSGTAVPSLHRLEIGWRTRLWPAAIDLRATSRLPGEETTWRARASREVAGERARTTATAHWSAAGPRLDVTVASLAGRVGWSRAAPGGSAWSARCRLLKSGLQLFRALELEVRGWRGEGGRRAAGGLGGGLDVGGLTLGPAAESGAIVACRLDLQRQPVRVRLALVARDAPDESRDALATCHIQWLAVD